MMRNYACLMMAALFCLVVGSCKKEHTVRPQSPPVDSLPVQPPPAGSSGFTADETEGFKQMTVYTTQQVTKWQSPVTVYVADTSFLSLTAQLDSVISEINTLLDTNLSIRRVSTREGSSIQVYFTDEDTYLKEEPAVAAKNLRFIGFGYAAWDSTWQIYHGSMFVDTAATANNISYQRFVIHHEFMHTLGFVGHVTVSTLSSVMFPAASAPYLPGYTEFDKKSIRLLYNPSVKAGMNETEVNAIIAGL